MPWTPQVPKLILSTFGKEEGSSPGSAGFLHLSPLFLRDWRGHPLFSIRKVKKTEGTQSHGS